MKEEIIAALLDCSIVYNSMSLENILPTYLDFPRPFAIIAGPPTKYPLLNEQVHELVLCLGVFPSSTVTGFNTRANYVGQIQL